MKGIPKDGTSTTSHQKSAPQAKALPSVVTNPPGPHTPIRHPRGGHRSSGGV